MIGYALFGTNDLEKAVAFYDGLFEQLGAQRALSTERIITWATGEGAMFGICTPADGQKATFGNGTMLAFPMVDRSAVDAIYAKALHLGATSHAAPETADEHGFYGGYVRDLDMNKLCFYHM